MTYIQWEVAHAHLQVKYEARQRATAAAEDALERAKEALNKAREQEEDAGTELRNFEFELMKSLRDKFFTADLLNAPKMKLISQDGSEFNSKIRDPWVHFLNGKLRLTIDKEASVLQYFLGEYNEPAEIEIVADLLKAAVKRGDTEFTFPSAKEVDVIHSGKRINGEWVNVCYEGEELGFVDSSKYGGILHSYADGRKVYMIRSDAAKLGAYRCTEEEFFKVMAERGACTIDEHATAE